MTVADNTSRNQYTATSGQTVFAYTFEIVDKGDIVVLQNGTTLSEGTNYTVSGVGAENGGNITLTVGATAGDIMTLYRDMAYVRTQNYADSGDFLASEVNTDFDNLWLAGEQTNRSFSQSIRKPITDSDSISMELPEAADRANSFLTFDATGAPTVTSVGDPGAPSSIVRQQFTGDGTTTAFTLASAPGALGQSVQIFIDGVYQENDTYSISGTTLTFTEAPPVNASIETVRFEVNDIGETSANLVSYTPAGTGAVQTTVQTKLRESVSVKDFGAVGDGVTDDTAAIQAAIDYAISSGIEVVIPKGEYKVTSTLLADHTKISDKNGIGIRGLGASFRDSRIVYSGTGYALDCSGDGDESGTTITRFRLSNFSIFGNQTTSATGALNISRTFQVELDRLELGSFYSSSAIVLNAQNVFSLAVNNCHIYCAENDTDIGTAKGDCVLVGSPDPDSWSSSNLVFTGGLLQRGDYGLRVTASHVGSLDNLTIDNVSIGNNRENNLRIPDVTGRITTVTLKNVHFENAGRTGSSTIALKDSVYVNDIDSLSIDNCHSNGANVHYNLLDISSINIIGGGILTATLWQPTLTAATGFSITAPNNFSKAFIGPVNIITAQIATPFSIASSVNYVYNTNQEHDSAYTPALTLGSGSVTYDTQDGSYSRIGNLVFFEAHVDLASATTPSGALQINLPVTPTTDSGYRSALAVYYENLDLNPAADIQLIVEIAGGTTTGVFKFARDNSGGQNVASSLTASSVIVVQGTYRA